MLWLWLTNTKNVSLILFATEWYPRRSSANCLRKTEWRPVSEISQSIHARVQVERDIQTKRFVDFSFDVVCNSDLRVRKRDGNMAGYRTKVTVWCGRRWITWIFRRVSITASWNWRAPSRIWQGVERSNHHIWPMLCWAHAAIVIPWFGSLVNISNAARCFVSSISDLPVTLSLKCNLHVAILLLRQCLLPPDGL